MPELKQVPWPGWKTVRLIGYGSYGTVYEIQRSLPDGDTESAAVKMITIPQNPSDIEEMRSEGHDDTSITATFRAQLNSIVAEYSLMRKMDGSANVVNCKDIAFDQHADGIGWDIFIRMELLTPLLKALPKEVPEDMVVSIGVDICQSLVLCKKHGIVHRDIKPQNMFMSANGDFKLGDFGIARTMESTMGGTKAGTYKYMAPEVYNNQPYGSSADIYSLGIVLYWLLNMRRMPFVPLPPTSLQVGQDEKALLRRVSGEKLPAPANGSRELKRIVLKACAYNPSERYASAAQMLEDLRRVKIAKVMPEEDATVLIGLAAAPASDATVRVSRCQTDDRQENTRLLAEEPDSGSFEESVAEYDDEYEEKAAFISNRKSFVFVLASIILILCLGIGVAFWIYSGNNQTTQQKNWSSWMDKLPGGITAQNYMIETQNQYSYRSLVTTTSTEPVLSGWECYDSDVEYADWSDWSAQKTDSTATRQVETQTQYRYCDKEFASSTYPNRPGWAQYDTSKTYGNWSNWSTTYPSGADLDIENKMVKIGVRYRMGHYCTGNVPGAQWQTASNNQTNNTTFNQNCEFHDLGWFSSLDNFTKADQGGWYVYKGYGASDGYRCSNECYRFYILETEDVYETQYRYRSVQTVYLFYRWGEWSEWSTTKPIATDACKVDEPRTVYRYRDVLSATYYFQRWSEWSAYTTIPVTPSETTQVRNKIRYRYKSK